eukprot:2668436-Ditylum_brightwellii.AAC.1
MAAAVPFAAPKLWRDVSKICFAVVPCQNHCSAGPSRVNGSMVPGRSLVLLSSNSWVMTCPGMSGGGVLDSLAWSDDGMPGGEACWFLVYKGCSRGEGSPWNEVVQPVHVDVAAFVVQPQFGVAHTVKVMVTKDVDPVLATLAEVQRSVYW